ncbi:hypothetical protein M5K25_002361 [Dendrobium thyrsiflorum]|uniref:Retrovirus-related Pol polyprotein from transposon TNT 1-94 n=1 Tax=Dendrobium thyrsiflorum TaxID=117978 RepID=A0ABD0VSN4_DENTH
MADDFLQSDVILGEKKIEVGSKALRFEGFLNGSSVYPPRSINIDSGQLIPNPDYTNWTLLDQNLAAALYSVVSSTILPYVLSVEQCNDIWTTLDRQLQSSTRSRIIQIKNELHYLSMKDKSMTQYLLDIKAKVDSLAAAGAPMDVEDVIHYTLNGLPPTYQAFKTAIRTNLQPLSLDDLYTLLCSEELNLAHETTKELQSLQLSDNTMALTASRGRGRVTTSLCSVSHKNSGSFIPPDQEAARPGLFTAKPRPTFACTSGQPLRSAPFTRLAWPDQMPANNSGSRN